MPRPVNFLSIPRDPQLFHPAEIPGTLYFALFVQRATARFNVVWLGLVCFTEILTETLDKFVKWLCVMI
jgi:hypothetical protein